MISNSKQISGFTLIELLVVMLITVLGLSVVGPGIFGVYEKIGRSAEEQKLADIVEGASLKCFFRQTGNTLTFEGNRIDLTGLETIVTFEYITFPRQVVDFNGNGYSDTQKITYHAGKKEKTLPLGYNDVQVTPG